MDVSNDIVDMVEWLADFAASAQQCLGGFLLVAAAVSFVLVWQLYDGASPVWWNLLKGGVALVPILLWAIIWGMLSQLREVPEVARSLANQQGAQLKMLGDQAKDRKLGFIGFFATLRELRQNEAFETVTGMIGSIALLANPLFILLASFMFAVLVLYIVAVPLSLVF